MNNSFYFPHDIYAAHSKLGQAILRKLGPAGYGQFWLVIEKMHTTDGRFSPDDLEDLSFVTHVPVGEYKQLLGICLANGAFVVESDGTYTNQRVAEQIEKRKEISKIRSRLGKAGALAKAQKEYKAIATPIAEAIAPAIVQQVRKGSKEVSNTSITSTNVDVSDTQQEDFRHLLSVATRIFGTEKKYSPAGWQKYKARRKNFSAQEIIDAFENLLNEYDRWKINNNNGRSMAWWLHSDQRIEDMQNCHLKRPASPQLKAIIVSE